MSGTRTTITDYAVISNLKASGIIDFVCTRSHSIDHGAYNLQTRNNDDQLSVTIIVCENEKWRSWGSWGNVKGVHLMSWDRDPFTDEEGKESLKAGSSHSDLKPIKGFRWATEWSSIVDESTDEEGYQYAKSWDGLNIKSGSKPFKPERKLQRKVRRRRWTRTMERMSAQAVEAEAAITYPYKLNIIIKSASFTTNITPHQKIESYVEVYVDGVLRDKTPTGPPSWNKVVTLSFLQVKPATKISFHVYKKKLNLSTFLLKVTYTYLFFSLSYRIISYHIVSLSLWRCVVVLSDG